MLAQKQTTSPDRQTVIDHRQHLCWQRFSLRVPADWNAIKLEGDFKQGMVLLADLESPRLGIRWATPKKSKQSPAEAVAALMCSEVGELATKEAATPKNSTGRWKAELLYEDPEPPGRDVWVGLSETTSRLVQVSYHAKKRCRTLANELVPHIADQPENERQKWSVLDLSCRIPPEYALVTHQLSAGDLQLSFEAPQRRRIVVRQIGPATLAISRQPIERWLETQIGPARKLYRTGKPEPATIETDDAPLTGLRVTQHRRRRAFLHRTLPMELVTLALNDKQRNRLVIIQAGDLKTAEQVAQSVGWAARNGGLE